MTQTPNDPSYSTGEEGTTPVSPTAEQGTSEAERTDVTGEQSAESGDSTDAAESGQDAENPADDNEKPIWDVSVQGPLDEDDPRRDKYEIVNE